MSTDFTLHVVTEDGTETLGQVDDLRTRGAAATAMPRALRRTTGISSDKLMESWRNTNSVIVAMMKDAQEKEKEQGLRLNEISVSLKVTAEGTIGFVSGEAEAGITLKFTRA